MQHSAETGLENPCSSKAIASNRQLKQIPNLQEYTVGERQNHIAFLQVKKDSLSEVSAFVAL
eukprot:3210350-Amphidinium_carterae.1